MFSLKNIQCRFYLPAGTLRLADQHVRQLTQSFCLSSRSIHLDLGNVKELISKQTLEQPRLDQGDLDILLSRSGPIAG